jgi:hypothetical protein
MPLWLVSALARRSDSAGRAGAVSEAAGAEPERPARAALKTYRKFSRG